MARIGFQFTHIVDLYRSGLKRFMRVSNESLWLTLRLVVLGRAQPLDIGIERSILRLPSLKNHQ